MQHVTINANSFLFKFATIFMNEFECLRFNPKDLCEFRVHLVKTMLWLALWTSLGSLVIISPFFYFHEIIKITWTPFHIQWLGTIFVEVSEIAELNGLAFCGAIVASFVVACVLTVAVLFGIKYLGEGFTWLWRTFVPSTKEVEKNPSAVTLMYHSWKDQYCAKVEIKR